MKQLNDKTNECRAVYCILLTTNSLLRIVRKKVFKMLHKKSETSLSERKVILKL